MERRIYPVLLLVLLVLAACAGDSGSNWNGETLYRHAALLDSTGAYVSAKDRYQQARTVLISEGNTTLADQCRLSIYRIEKILSEYNTTEAGVRAVLKGKFPDISESKIIWLLSRIDYLDIEGTRYYFYGFLNTTVHLDLSLMAQTPAAVEAYRKFFDNLSPYVFSPGQATGSPFQNPIKYVGNITADIPRKEIPATGTLKIWLPVPIITECQTEVSIVSVNPEQYVKQPATINGDLGDIYLEVPLEQLTGNLSINIRFKFTHYEQRFTMIDPNNVGQYDKNSELYKKYTVSEKNIFISPEITAKAQQLATGEQNPYLIARKIYDHVVDDITYSYMPHLSLESLGMPESVYVYEHRLGDCGAQSIYFAALLRSLGIPARATGGRQMIVGTAGDHFWAEFYLPNYGWVPVDTSIAQLYLFPLGQTQDQALVYKDYFFASLDPLRWVIQKNVNLPFVPASSEPSYIALALQEPEIVCESMDESPTQALGKFFQVEVKPEQ